MESDVPLITVKQQDYMKHLLAKRTGFSEGFRERVTRDGIENGIMTRNKASEVISWLLERPYAKKLEVTPEGDEIEWTPKDAVADGMYITDAREGYLPGGIDVYRVKESRSGSKSAQRLSVITKPDGTKSGRFRFVPWKQFCEGKNRRPMDLAEAQKHGKLFGVCVRCGRVLATEESVSEGIGPKCKKILEGGICGS